MSNSASSVDETESTAKAAKPRTQPIKLDGKSPSPTKSTEAFIRWFCKLTGRSQTSSTTLVLVMGLIGRLLVKLRQPK